MCVYVCVCVMCLCFFVYFADKRGIKTVCQEGKETGKILKSATYDYKGEIDELLTNGMRMVSIELIK